MVTGTGPVRGRRISIMPCEFGVQIAVEQKSAPAFAAGAVIKPIVPRRETITVNSKSFLLTDFTFLIGDFSEPLVSIYFNRVNPIERIAKSKIKV